MDFALVTSDDTLLTDMLSETDTPDNALDWTVRIQKKGIVFREHEHCHGVYQVLSGLIKSTRITRDGVEQITNFHLPGDIFGFESLLVRNYSTNAIAITDASLLRINQKDIDQSNNAFAMLYQHLTEEYLRSQKHLSILNKTRAEVKVAAFISDILQRVDSQTGTFNDFAFRRTDIASYLGLSVETVSRALRYLKQAGAINVYKTRISVVDWDKLGMMGDY